MEVSAVKVTKDKPNVTYPSSKDPKWRDDQITIPMEDIEAMSDEGKGHWWSRWESLVVKVKVIVCQGEGHWWSKWRSLIVKVSVIDCLGESIEVNERVTGCQGEGHWLLKWG